MGPSGYMSAGGMQSQSGHGGASQKVRERF